MDPPIKLPAGHALAYFLAVRIVGAPLFEEIGDGCCFALVTNIPRPFATHRAGPMTRLPANDHPVDATKINFAKIFQKGFD